MTMKLYGNGISPFVRHCRLAMMQQGQAFEFVDADLDAVGALSPTKKMPYFTDGDLSLSDSSSIVKYVREKSGSSFLSDVKDYERFTMANTVMDTLINFRILSAEGFSPDTIKYMGKQQLRTRSGLEALDQSIDMNADLTEDSTLRTACLIDWGLFREVVKLDGLSNLEQLLQRARQDEQFRSTAPSLG